MVHARFRADGTSAVRVDEVGTVSVVVFNRRMGGWWGARQSTVLAAGKPVFTLEVLGSVPAATPTAVAQLCPSLVAISTEENTFVVSYDERGTTKPLFRWPPPAPVGAASVNAAAAANAASATASANAAALPCLAWTWHNALPVLARGWGCTIELVVGQQAAVASSAGGAPAASALRFVVAGAPITTEHVVHALRWLDGARVVYLSLLPTGPLLTVIDTVQRQGTRSQLPLHFVRIRRSHLTCPP